MAEGAEATPPNPSASADIVRWVVATGTAVTGNRSERIISRVRKTGSVWTGIVLVLSGPTSHGCDVLTGERQTSQCEYQVSLYHGSLLNVGMTCRLLARLAEDRTSSSPPVFSW